MIVISIAVTIYHDCLLNYIQKGEIFFIYRREKFISGGFINLTKTLLSSLKGVFLFFHLILKP